MVTRRSAMKMLAAGPQCRPSRRGRPSFNPTIRRKWRRRSPGQAGSRACLRALVSPMPYPGPLLDGLKDDPEFEEVAFFRVDYDNQKDVVAKLACPRSTVIAYKGSKEV